ncbi:MAG: T9SS type A sorting domain-containing protein [Bacteroidota bacterium]
MKLLYAFSAFILVILFTSHVSAQAFLNANGPGNTFEEITAAFAPGNDTSAVEDPQCIHAGRHIAEVWDADQGKYVYEFYMHVAVDNDRCINFDRQRVEIKTYEPSPDNLKGVTGETILYKWRFKVPVGFKPSSNFTHIHQIKAVGGDESDPLITLTVRKGSPNKIELIHNNITKVAIVNLSLFEGNWVECTEAITVDSLHGKYSMSIKKVSDGTTILTYSNNDIMTIRYNNNFIRPKWGIYRSLLNSADLRDDTLRFSDFYICENATTVLPAAPTTLSLSVISSTQINLTWTDNASTEENFLIERSPDGSAWTQIASVNPNSTAYSDASVTSGTSYYYRVRSSNTFGNSSYSNTANSTTPVGSVKYTSTGNSALWSTQVWSPAGTPGSIDSVVIANDMTLDADISVAQLTVNSGSTLTAATSRTISGNIAVKGSFIVSGTSVTVTASGNVTVTGAAAVMNIVSSSNKLQGSSGKTFTLSNGAAAKFSVASTASPATLIPSFTWVVDNSVNATTITMAGGSTNVTISDLPNSQLYGNIILTTSSSAGPGPTYTFSSARTINGNLSYQSLGRPLIVNQSAVITSNGSNASVTSTAATQTVAVNISAAGIPFTGFSSATLTGTSGVTVTYNGSSAQTVLGGQYGNLTLSNSSGVSLGGNTNVSGALTLTNTLMSLGASNLTLGASAVISGTPSASNMIVTNGTGELQRSFTSAGSFTYPIGENTGTAEYSPVTLTINSASAFSSAYVGARVTDGKHPSNSSTTNYLSRYWTLNASGLTSPDYNVTFSYLTADVNGTETSIYGGRFNSSWVLMSPVNAAANTFTGTSLTSFSDFTGGESSVLPVELVSFTAAEKRSSVELRWSTATEMNYYGFDIERATVSGEILIQNWHSVGFIQGGGTTSIPRSYTFSDKNITSGSYAYRLKQVDMDGKYTYSPVIEITVTKPKSFELMQNYPNPFNPSTRIDYSVPAAGRVHITVTNMLGQQLNVLVDEYKESGKYSAEFNAAYLPSGVYFYTLRSGTSSIQKKMILTK